MCKKKLANEWNSYIIDTDSNGNNSVEKEIHKYSNHFSLLLIKGSLKNIPSFSFNKVHLPETERELNLINPTKVTTSKSIPQKLVQSIKNICWDIEKNIQ